MVKQTPTAHWENPARGCKAMWAVWGTQTEHSQHAQRKQDIRAEFNTATNPLGKPSEWH
jgi:hypothetical protein